MTDLETSLASHPRSVRRQRQVRSAHGLKDAIVKIGPIVQALTLVVSLTALIGGGVVALQIKTAHEDWIGVQQQKSVDDHEARLRSLEKHEGRIDGKLDLIMERLGIRDHDPR